MPERLDAGSNKRPESGKRQEPQSAEEIRPSDFMKPEHYFDALDAMRILNEMRRAG